LKKTKIFLHGLESSPQGNKGVYFRDKYPEMLIPDFTGNLRQRMIKLNNILSKKDNIILVGSSFGGLMALIFTMANPKKVEKLILLAPAIHMLKIDQGENNNCSIPVWIYHGKNDTVIPLVKMESVARNIFTNLSFIIMADDHSLTKTFKTIDWDSHLGY